MTDVIAALIQGLVDDAEVVDQAKQTIKVNDGKRAMLRDAMIDAHILESIDEVSGYKAVLSAQEKDVYIAEKLVPLLRPEDVDKVIQTVVDNKAVEAIVDGGGFSRAFLLREGALVRAPKTRPFIKLVALTGARP